MTANPPEKEIPLEITRHLDGLPVINATEPLVMTDDELENAANDAFNQVKPILTGMSCQIVGTVLSYLTANWLLSLQAEPPDPEETETLRADALENLALETVRLVRDHEKLLRNPQ